MAGKPRGDSESGTSRARAVRRGRRAAVLSLAALVGLVACGSDSPTIPEGAEVIEARLPPTFSPSTLTVPVGTTVVWRNETLLTHTITPIDHSAWSRGELADRRGSIYQVVLTEPGVYPYVCELHGGQGMSGVIRVE